MLTVVDMLTVVTLYFCLVAIYYANNMSVRTRLVSYPYGPRRACALALGTIVSQCRQHRMKMSPRQIIWPEFFDGIFGSNSLPLIDFYEVMPTVTKVCSCGIPYNNMLYLENYKCSLSPIPFSLHCNEE